MAAASRRMMTTTPSRKRGSTRAWAGRFGRRRTTTKTEVSRDDEHEEDVATQSKFEMLCEGEPSSSLSTAHPKRQSPETTVARAGGWICRGRNNHGRGDDSGDNGTGDASVTTTTTNGYNTYYDETTRITI
jgi:hypothetical protein